MKKTRYETILSYGFAIGIALFKVIGLVIQIQQATYAQQVIRILRDSLIPPLYAFCIWYLCHKYEVGRRISNAVVSQPILGAVIPAVVGAAGVLFYDHLLFPLSGIFALAMVLRMSRTFYSATKRMIPVCLGLACVAVFVGHDLFGATTIIIGMLIMSIHTDEIYPDHSYSAFVLELVYMAAVSAIVFFLNKETVMEIAMELYSAPQTQYLLSHLFIKPIYVGVPLLVIPPLLAYFFACELAQSNDKGYPPFVMGALAFLASHAYLYWAVSMNCLTVFVPMELMGGTFVENIVFYMLVFMILPPDRLLPWGRTCDQTADSICADWYAEDPDLSEEEATAIRHFVKFTEKYNKAMKQLPELRDFLSEEQWDVVDPSDEYLAQEEM